ncbi:hypothetical protein [Bacillus sp. JCM 19041]
MAETEQISNNLLQHAFQMNASDVHFLPSTEVPNPLSYSWHARNWVVT